MNTEEFINKANKVHNGKYDYSKVEYVNAKTKICIICPEHGEFWQTPNNHLSGKGCALCANENKLHLYNKSNDKFISEAQMIHNGKYDYSKVEYVNAKTKICIICPEHGEFWQTPHNHLQGQGCPKCSPTLKLNKDVFIENSNKKHNGKYDYSKVKYINNRTKVCIICPEHGEFWQTPSNHMYGYGCAKCANSLNAENHTSNTDIFIEKAKLMHLNKYDYSKVKYINNRTKVCIICPEHGEFWQTPDAHLSNKGCPKCGRVMSNPEDEIVNVLDKFCSQQRNHTILKGKELDIFIPSLKIGIEYNGLRWHSEDFGKDHRYHLDKLNKCNEQGIKLIQIFEDEWINHRKICESKLRQICGLNTNPKIFGRKCEIREISNKNEAYDFLDKNHIQGRTVCTVALGAYHQEELVGIMTFKREKEGYWDLNRFATDINYQCVGIGGKLFKYFTKHYDFKEIKSFADRRWTTDPTDNLYIKLGFEFDSFVEPTYWYYNPKVDRYKRFHKFGFRKQSLHNQYGLPLEMTEREMTTTLGYTRIWDCGLIKYIYKNLEK